MTITPTIPYWTPPPTPRAERRLRECLLVLSNRRQRTVLGVLAEQWSLSVTELVGRLVAIEQDTPRAEVDPAEIERTRIDLVHVRLPQLAAAGFVTTSRESAEVRLADHPLLDVPHIEWLLAAADAWDDIPPGVAVGRNRTIRAILEASPSPLSCGRLVELVWLVESTAADTPDIPDIPNAHTV
ncbi:MAG: DUF7344 domain-containing protein [Halohasta sp.]